jgi:hypothetical protein
MARICREEYQKIGSDTKEKKTKQSSGVLVRISLEA